LSPHRLLRRKTAHATHQSPRRWRPLRRPLLGSSSWRPALAFLHFSSPTTMAPLDSPRSISSSNLSDSSQVDLPLLPASSSPRLPLFARAAQANSTPPRSARRTIALLGAGALVCNFFLAWYFPPVSEALVVAKTERELFVSPARRLSSANEERRGGGKPAGVEEVSFLGGAY
jgi:hypothetical protein